MRGEGREGLRRSVAALGLLAGVVTIVTALWRPSARPAGPSQLWERRRAYDGAPPVIPHALQTAACVVCHDDRGREVPGMGMAPANPHGATPGIGKAGRCLQCHLVASQAPPLAGSAFVGLGRVSWRGSRMYPGAPPVVPHRLFMREDCLACHAGPAARPEIRTTHPERTRCLQCHLALPQEPAAGFP